MKLFNKFSVATSNLMLFITALCAPLIANASSLDLAKCVNANNKAASVMKSVGNLEQQRNFLKFVEGFTLVGNKLYGDEFASNLRSTKRASDAMSNEELAQLLPKCISLANTLNTQMASSIGSKPVSNAIPFEIINQSTQHIDQVFASPSNAKSWGRDLMGERFIPIGQKATISPSVTDICEQDIKVVFRDKSEYEASKKDLCSSQTFTLGDNSRMQKTQSQVNERTYCAVSDMGGPPIGCGLTLGLCRSVTAGLAGMSCR